MPAKHLRITGLVQGVFFRAETLKKATELGLTGWVRNTDDGAVEVHAQGAEEKLKELEQWCTKGPPRAQVQNVSVDEVPEEDLQKFSLAKAKT